METERALFHTELVPVDELVIDPVQSRETDWNGDEPDRRLADSIAANGLLQDLLVRPIEYLNDSLIDGHHEQGSYAIIAGSRRYQAAMDAGYEELPCKVLEIDTVEAAWQSLTENTERADLSEQEVAQQLKLIYELVRPRSEPTSCPQCASAVDGETGLYSHYGQSTCEPPALPDPKIPLTELQSDESGTYRFTSDRQAERYIARRFIGRDDDSALSRIQGHLQTAGLPELVQALFKPAEDRTDREQTALNNFGVDTQATLGSGDGRSKASEVIASMYKKVDNQVDNDALEPTEAVLDAVGTLQSDDVSEKQLEKSLRSFKRSLGAELDTSASAAEQRQQFSETLEDCAEELRTATEKLAVQRPFKRVDVVGPTTQRHSRWHERVKARREVTSHGELVRELYQERLETIAEQEGWE